MDNEYLLSLRKTGKHLFDQLSEQGVNPGEASLIGLEIAALGLENAGTPANRGAKTGWLSVFAHRILSGVLVNPREHADVKGCDTCEKLKSLAP